MIQRISSHQFMILSSGILLGTAFLPIAQILAAVAGRDSWWSVMPGYLIAVPYGLMVLSFMQRYPGQNLLQISGNVFGKWAGKAIAVYYILVAGYIGALYVARAVDTYKRMIAPFMPQSVYTIGVILLVIALAWAGIEVLARFSEFCFPLVVIGLIITMLLAIPRFEWDQFFPVLANGIKPVVFGAVKTLSFPLEYIVSLTGLIPFLPTAEQSRLRSGLLRAVVLVGIIMTLVTLTEIMVFGPMEAARLNLGILSLGKMIEIAKTIAGIESVFEGLWLGAAILKITIAFFLVVWGLEYIFGFRKKFWLYAGIGLIFFIIAILQEGGTQVYLELSIAENYFLVPFALLWVPLLWFVERLRRRFGKR
ncbi:MAG: endospore germination permease [Desulfitobacteriaceae bacterium]|nr:endospore germination permease [Desulfitobacteriaceae bacterium]MDD4345374.1 endospore germination permease [Desulfitobacteriaceae bacterium]MDD4400303.1 endospore germination permease [Desulfitobacteriaceae bacterium]